MNKKNEKEITIKVNIPEEVTLSGLYGMIVELSSYDLNVVGELIEKMSALYLYNSKEEEIDLNYKDFIKQVYWAHLFESGRREFIDCDCHIGCCWERV